MDSIVLLPTSWCEILKDLEYLQSQSDGTGIGSEYLRFICSDPFLILIREYMVVCIKIGLAISKIVRADLQSMAISKLIYQKSSLNAACRIYQQHLAACQKMFLACNSFTYLKSFPLTQSTIYLRQHQVSYNNATRLESFLASSPIVRIN